MPLYSEKTERFPSRLLPAHVDQGSAVQSVAWETWCCGGPEITGVFVLVGRCCCKQRSQLQRTEGSCVADCDLASDHQRNSDRLSRSHSRLAEVSFCSWGSGSPGTRYSPSTHRPRSTSWHRSEQKGRKGLSFHSTGLPQVGHFMNLEPHARPTSQRDAGRLISIRRLTNAIVPSRRMAFKRTVTLSRVEPTIEAISR